MAPNLYMKQPDIMELLNFAKSDIRNKEKINHFIIKRRKTIEVMKILCEKLENLEDNCRIVEIISEVINDVSTAVKLVGYGVLLFGQFIVGSKLVIGASCGQATGTVLGLGTALCKYGFTNSYINEIEEVLKEDEDVLRSTVRNIYTKAELFYEVFGFRLDSEFCQDGLKIIDHFLDLMKQPFMKCDEAIEIVKRDYRSSKDISSFIMGMGDTLKLIFNTVRKNRRMIELLREICLIFRENPKLYFGYEGCKSLIGSGMALTWILSPGNSTSGMVADAAFSGIFVAQRLFNRLTKDNFFENDAFSFAKKAKDILQNLEAELKLFVRVQEYKDLTNKFYSL